MKHCKQRQDKEFSTEILAQQNKISRKNNFIGGPMPSGLEVRRAPLWTKESVKFKADVYPKKSFLDPFQSVWHNLNQLYPHLHNVPIICPIGK